MTTAHQNALAPQKSFAAATAEASDHYSRIKRAIDLALAGLMLLTLAPVFMGIALAIRLNSNGNVFFVQTRIGKNGKPFRMMKFRTMFKDAEARRAELLTRSERVGVCFKMAKDPRVTRVGEWLRKTSLDELPQIINVLKGDMSLVGPRPALQEEVDTYDSEALKRLDGLPGITCLWQVAGRADLSFQKQVELDVAYLRARSTLLDLVVIAITPIAMISRRGAY